ncbi:MAG: dephospho-CoA kinase [Kiritimatiellae bacterium]|jgi:dephospho-CoA kinase|nr:dephospho-CoA kinase [Kiritimatiellia bacterium]
MRVAVTGGIACGKSLFSQYLNEFGVETIDADDVVHELVPEEERRKLAKVVFEDEAARKALEARIHPLVKARIDEFLSGGGLRAAVVPLLFEVQWERNFDIICAVVSTKENQVSRMVATRGYTLQEAEARLAAQLPVEEKARRAHYTVRNDATAAELKTETRKFVTWLKNLTCSPHR